MKFNFEDLKKKALTTTAILATAVPAFSQENQEPDPVGESKITSMDEKAAIDSLTPREDTVMFDDVSLENKDVEFTFAELEKIYKENGGGYNTITRIGNVEVQGWGSTWYEVEGEEVAISYNNDQGEKVKEKFLNFQELQQAHPVEYQTIRDSYQALYEKDVSQSAWNILTDQLEEALPTNYEEFQPDQKLLDFIEDIARKRVAGENRDGYDDIIDYLSGGERINTPEATYKATKKWGYSISGLASYLQRHQFDDFVKKFEMEQGK